MPAITRTRERRSPWTAGWSVAGALLLLAACATGGRSTRVGADGPLVTVWGPASGQAPAVLVLSGFSGPPLYEAFAADLAREGYWVGLLDGKDVFTRALGGEPALRRTIDWARTAPGARQGKVAIVGFSWGGAAALAHAAAMDENVSVVVAYYPYTAWVSDPRMVVDRLRVPTLVLAGERDRYRDCCLIDTVRAIDASARGRAVPFTLVSYPSADHGFNLAVPAHNAADTADAWRRTVETLRRYHPR